MQGVETERRNLGGAEDQVAEGKRRASEQRHRIERLRENGHDTALAERLLATLEETLAEWIAHRDAILQALIRAGVRPAGRETVLRVHEPN